MAADAELVGVTPVMEAWEIHQPQDAEGAGGAEGSSADLTQLEGAAHERRHWVRLTAVCNNRCDFCHDSPHQDGTMLDPEVLRAKIRQGRDEGAQRLILSGGEATIHPAFLDLVAYGREVGYDWIQTVTNGRVFSYGSFARKAAEAGLNEATFSMHGHTPALHDALVGAKGAFMQATKGIRNLQKTGRVVVNLDVVINKQNLTALPAIIDFYLGLGIREFDLLWLVPFGRAWEHRDALFIDRVAPPPGLAAAIRRARAAGATLWTNRLPPQLLEGVEELIQDPHKLQDEVHGRKPEFEDWLLRDQPMRCRQPERCSHCFIEHLCDAIERREEARAQDRVEALLVQGALPDPAWLARAERIDVRARTLARATALAAAVRAAQPEIPLHVEIAPGEDAAPPASDEASTATPNTPATSTPEATVDAAADLAGLLTHTPARVASSDPAILDALLAAAVPLEVVLDQRSAPWVADNAAGLLNAAGRAFVSARTYLTRSATLEHGVVPARALAPLQDQRGHGGQGGAPALTLVNLPACTLPGARAVDEPAAHPAATLEAMAQRADMEAFTDAHILHGYRAKSIRCETCAAHDRCRGLAINHVRAFGLESLRPL